MDENINPFDKSSSEYQTFLNLKNILSTYYTNLASDRYVDLKKTIDSSLLANYCFNFSILSPQQQSLILHLEDKLGVMTLRDILNFEDCYIDEFELSKAKQNCYNEILLKINEHFEKISLTESFISAFICLSCESIGFPELEKFIISDLESYLISLDKDHRYITLSRLGYTQPEETLEHIGQKIGLTRERVRQIESNNYIYLRHFLRVHPTAIWEKIDDSFENLLESFPKLSKLFENEKLFISFIEIITNKPKEFISSQFLPEYQDNILDELFVTNTSPYPKTSVINFLISEYGYSNLAAISILNQLESKKIIELSEQGATPKKLSQANAVAHALTFHPKGLPWKDVCDIVNRNSFSCYLLNDTRPTHGFKINDYVYLYGRGIYRNLIFSNLEQIDCEEILLNVKKILLDEKIETKNLYDFFKLYFDKPQLKHDYYLFRYLISTYGEGFGLYFTGRSSSDILSIGRKVELHSQENIILDVLGRSNKALGVDNLAGSIKSKSKCHVNLYLHNLLKNNKVIRIGRDQYSTPDNAFSGIDKEKIFAEIGSILSSTNKIVELDIFRERINQKLGYSFSKYFYGSIISYFGESETKITGIKKVNNFVSNLPFEIQTFSELIDAFTSNNEKTYVEDVVSKIKGVISITTRVEQTLKSNLRHIYNLEYRPKSDI